MHIFYEGLVYNGLAMPTILLLPYPLIDNLYLRIFSYILLEMIIIGIIVLAFDIIRRFTSAQIIHYAITSPGRDLILRKGPSSKTVLRPGCRRNF